ncbi:hypothetical protein M0R19_00180 [Candidatus Pacearchaeota archaeon]|nr:hypothetical protein [Candidatus Pacearchaeota archaeon]
MNKKGFLLGEETLKIIIAVIAIGFLVYLLAALYFSLNSEQKAKEAQASLNDILMKEIIRLGSNGTYNEQGILIPNPSGWYILGFTSEKKPNSCTGTNCVCICENALINIFDAQIKNCDKKGSCVVVPSLKEFAKIKIEKDGTPILIQKLNDFLMITKK